MNGDPYGRDVLAQPRRRGPQVPVVVAERGLVVEDAASGYCGAVVGFEKSYDGLFVRLGTAAVQRGFSRCDRRPS